MSRSRLATLLAAALALALGWAAVRGYRHLRSSVAVRAVTAAVTAIPAERLPAGLMANSLRLLRQAEQDRPAALAPRAARADLLLLVGRRRAAERAYREALAIEPRAELMFNLGLALWQQGEREAALEELGRAVLLDARLRPSLPAGAARALAAR